MLKSLYGLISEESTSLADEERDIKLFQEVDVYVDLQADTPVYWRDRVSRKPVVFRTDKKMVNSNESFRPIEIEHMRW